MKILLIKRSKIYSPNSIENDDMVICSLKDKLLKNYQQVSICMEDNVFDADDADVYVSMGRMPKTIDFLRKQEQNGAVVVNSTRSVEKAGNRSECAASFAAENINLPNNYMENGAWVKNNKAWSQTENDVLFVNTDKMLSNILYQYYENDKTKYVIQSHIKGDLVKFYGVRNTDFFYDFYPKLQGYSKFNNENINDSTFFYNYNKYELKQIANVCANSIGVDIYGGDCIINPKGEIFIIDFNDFPSFSPCREKATDAMCELIKQKVG